MFGLTLAVLKLTVTGLLIATTPQPIPQPASETSLKSENANQSQRVSEHVFRILGCERTTFSGSSVRWQIATRKADDLLDWLPFTATHEEVIEVQAPEVSFRFEKPKSAITLTCAAMVHLRTSDLAPLRIVLVANTSAAREASEATVAETAAGVQSNNLAWTSPLSNPARSLRDAFESIHTRGVSGWRIQKVVAFCVIQKALDEPVGVDIWSVDFRGTKGNGRESVNQHPELSNHIRHQIRADTGTWLVANNVPRAERRGEELRRIGPLPHPTESPVSTTKEEKLP